MTNSVEADTCCETHRSGKSSPEHFPPKALVSNTHCAPISASSVVDLVFHRGETNQMPVLQITRQRVDFHLLFSAGVPNAFYTVGQTAFMMPTEGRK